MSPKKRAVAVAPTYTYSRQPDWFAVQYSDFSKVQYYQQSDSETEQAEEERGELISGTNSR